jgi:aryl-alcohol dehydrogenase-like predicted oxidoreductase
MNERDSRRNFLQASLMTAAGGTLASAAPQAEKTAGSSDAAATGAVAANPPEWRNKQPGMAYRQFGRSGLMISEVVSGGDPISSENYKHLQLALDMGLNYLDMAPAYGHGDCEIAYGKFLRETSSRNRVFLQTKVSDYCRARNAMYKQIYDGLPADKRDAIDKRVEEIRRTTLAEKPGYYLTYFPGQQKQFPPTYLSSAMQTEFGERVNNSPELKKVIADSVDGSLQRVGTDHFDFLMCPHGATAADELDGTSIYEAFLDLRKQGKIRFLGVTSHNDPAAILRKAADTGHYDGIQLAYNVINGGYLDQAIADASAKGVGIIAMKAAHAVATHHKELQPLPQWRADKVNRIVPGDMKAPVKAYMWALQNPHISAVNSNLWDENFIRENLAVAGKKVDLNPA